MHIYRIHPAIGVARVGNSEDFVISPETQAGSRIGDGSPLAGGLPIRAETDVEPVRSGDLRDDRGALKRHAARFRIFLYPSQEEEAWPRGDGVEITVGTVVEGRSVKNIVWTVHLANKKANAFKLPERGDHEGVAAFSEGRLPPIRNPQIDDLNGLQPSHDEKISVLNAASRLRRLIIDPGPRSITGESTPSVCFDKPTPASFFDAGKSKVVSLSQYPKSFPDDSFPQLVAPAGPIDTLGELRTDSRGRLLVLGGYGRAVGWAVDGSAALDANVSNDQWFDDTSDGPVSATIIFDDDTHIQAQGAWVAVTAPSYAPQILNVVSLWDDVFDCWVRRLGLVPEIYNEANGGYQPSYKPKFDDEISPIFKSSALQRWVTNMNPNGASAHDYFAALNADNDPQAPDLAGVLSIFRNPFEGDHTDTKLMPLHLGDANEPLLTLRKTQYFFLKQWSQGRAHFQSGARSLGPGERLDKAVMVNCLGGRLDPGIDLTFVVREPGIYTRNWRTEGGGPFRIRAKHLGYESAALDKPLLSCGYVPRHIEAEGLEPGDLSKLMALPWHTDFNACALHLPENNPNGNRTVFWSWPAQRPVAVYSVDDIAWTPLEGSPTLGPQRWAIRGEGADSTRPERWSRYQDHRKMLEHWHQIGVVMQASAIDGAGSLLPSDWYLEVGSGLSDTGQMPVVPFPNLATAPSAEGDDSETLS